MGDATEKKIRVSGEAKKPQNSKNSQGPEYADRPQFSFDTT